MTRRRPLWLLEMLLILNSAWQSFVVDLAGVTGGRWCLEKTRLRHQNRLLVLSSRTRNATPTPYLLDNPWLIGTAKSQIFTQ